MLQLHILIYRFLFEQEALLCQVESILMQLFDSVENVTDHEFNTFLQVSDEEWGIIQPTRFDRTVSIIQQVSVGH